MNCEVFYLKELVRPPYPIHLSVLDACWYCRKVWSCCSANTHGIQSYMVPFSWCVLVGNFRFLLPFIGFTLELHIWDLGPLLIRHKVLGGNLCFRVVNFHQSGDEINSTSFSSAGVPCWISIYIYWFWSTIHTWLLSVYYRNWLHSRVTGAACVMGLTWF